MKFIKIFLILLFASFPLRAYSVVVEITQGQIAPKPVAVTAFTGNDAQLAREIQKIIESNLVSSGLFRLVDSSAFIEASPSINTKPRFQDWRLINSHLLLIGQVDVQDGTLVAKIRLYDVIAGTEMLGLEVSCDQVIWRRLAHTLSDAIYQRETGDSGFFDTQVVFVDEISAGEKNRKRRIGIMDSDGHAEKYITDGKEIVLMPAISPNGHEVVFLRFHNDSAHLYLKDLKSGGLTRLGDFTEMNYSPSFHPNGDVVVTSLIKKGNSAIYKYDIRSKELKALTQHRCIETSPSFSPDGEYVVYTSDESGRENIYIMRADGGGSHRISFGNGKYSQPVWSPRGDLIAFAKQVGGKFYIGVMNVDGSGERMIQVGSGLEVIQRPQWSPNGRYVLFSRERFSGKEGMWGKKQIMCIDLTGHNLRILKTSHDASSGCWSQLRSKDPFNIRPLNK